MDDNPLQDIHCRDFERDLRTSRSVREAIQAHRKHLKRFWWALFGGIGLFAILVLAGLLFGGFDPKYAPFPLLAFVIILVSFIGHIARLESGLKVLLLRKLMLEENRRKTLSARREAKSRN